MMLCWVVFTWVLVRGKVDLISGAWTLDGYINTKSFECRKAKWTSIPLLASVIEDITITFHADISCCGMVCAGCTSLNDYNCSRRSIVWVVTDLVLNVLQAKNIGVMALVQVFGKIVSFIPKGWFYSMIKSTFFNTTKTRRIDIVGNMRVRKARIWGLSNRVGLSFGFQIFHVLFTEFVSIWRHERTSRNLVFAAFDDRSIS